MNKEEVVYPKGDTLFMVLDKPEITINGTKIVFPFEDEKFTLEVRIHSERQKALLEEQFKAFK